MLIGDVWVTRDLVDEISSITARDPSTVRRWIRNGRIPPTAYRLLDLVYNGRLGRIHAAWDGWKLCARTGLLRTPTGEAIRSGHILAIPYRLAQVAHLQRQLHELRRPAANSDHAPVLGRRDQSRS